MTFGCSSSSSGTNGSGATQATTLAPCDPLAPMMLPVTLRTIIGIGKASDGTLQVGDGGTIGFTQRTPTPSTLDFQFDCAGSHS